MSHIMKSATVRDLRYHFPEIEARLQRGEEIEIRKRKRVIARLLPVRPKPEAYPDFAARIHEIFGDKMVGQTGAELVAEDRDRY
jgi:antitoxin (DNA-binding transcriptional repressor) of toxin-antitoxin stability system